MHEAGFSTLSVKTFLPFYCFIEIKVFLRQKGKDINFKKIKV